MATFELASNEIFTFCILDANEKFFWPSVLNIIDDSKRTLGRLQMRPLCTLTGIIAVIILLLLLLFCY